jgi:membrane protein YdbS with pleckstrin-like domain
MSAYGFRPNRKYFYKKLLQTLLIGFFSICLSSLAGAYIGEWIGGMEGAYTGRLVSSTVILAWLIPALILIYPTYRSHFYEIHENEVVIHSGLITRKVTKIPIRRITSLKVLRGPFDRAFGLGTIHVQTAGSNGYQPATEVLMGLQNYKEVFDQLAAAIKDHSNLKPLTFPAPNKEEVQILVELVDEVRKISAVLDSPEHQT